MGLGFMGFKVLSRSQTIDNVGQLLWAWFSFLRKSADEIVES